MQGIKDESHLRMHAQMARDSLKRIIELFDGIPEGDVTVIIIIVLNDLAKAIMKDIASVMQNDKSRVKGDLIMAIINNNLIEYANHILMQLTAPDAVKH